MQCEKYDLDAVWNERFGGPVSAGEVTCPYCNKVVDLKSNNVFRKVSGWEKQRGTGEGVRPIVMREVLGDFAHSWCVDSARHGGVQQSLLSSPEPKR